MRKDKFKIISNDEIAKDVYKLVIKGNTLGYEKPGVFAELSVRECFLKRPISISKCERDHLTLVFRAVGKGTKIMSGWQVGNEIELLGPLGNGYEILGDVKTPIVIGGGIGIPPLLGLVDKMIKKGIKPKAILGFNTKDEIFYEKEFKEILRDLEIYTIDGSYGNKGFVTEAFEQAEYIYACGPMPMLKAIDGKCKSGQFSLEARMGCGFGACMGCSIETTKGSKRVCKEGPIFNKEEILWED